LCNNAAYPRTGTANARATCRNRGGASHDSLGHLVGIGAPRARSIGHVNGTATNNRPAAGAGTEFRQGHPYGHDAILSLTISVSRTRPISRKYGFPIPQSAQQSVKCNIVNQLCRPDGL
jgi:hypothetical protein